MRNLIIIALISYVIYIIFKKRSNAAVESKREEPQEETFRDPVCGVYVAQGDAVVGRLDGERIHFCSMACLEKYRDQLPSSSQTTT